MTLVLKQLSIVFVLLFKNRRRREMKKNNSLLVIGIASISLLFILSVIQSSTAQRDDDDNDHDKDKWKWNKHDDDNDHDKDKWKWNKHDDDNDHDHDNFQLTVRLISDEERHIPDYKVKVSGETKSIDGEEFEDDGKANVKFYLNDVDNKERVCITNERTDDETCTKFNTDGDEGTVKFYIG
jgi:ABC-type Zn2+ transport system substrate-binding protein/surface adhesin